LYDIKKLLVLLSKLLDGNFNIVAKKVLERLLKGDSEFNKLLQQWLKEVTEQNRIDINGTTFNHIMAEYKTVLTHDKAMLSGVSRDLLLSSVSTAFIILTRFAVGGQKIPINSKETSDTWLKLESDKVLAAIKHNSLGQWNLSLDQYADKILKDVKQIAINGILKGQNPRTTAYDIIDATTAYPYWQAETLMRTLQLTGYRDAMVVHQLSNSNIIESQIRIAALDDRTCMACVVLHGTELLIGERVDDHYNGRCTSISVVKGYDKPEVETGIDWFKGLSKTKQAEMMGYSIYDAWINGAITFNDFPVHINDPVFGAMIQEASLKGMLGTQAQKFYKNR
jgi:hypothetical protein